MAQSRLLPVDGLCGSYPNADTRSIGGFWPAKELTGRETEPWEIVYLNLYKSQIPIIDQAIETAALMLGTDKSRGYCMEMICADFLAGANVENENREVLLQLNFNIYSHCARRFLYFCAFVHMRNECRPHCVIRFCSETSPEWLRNLCHGLQGGHRTGIATQNLVA